MLPRPNQIAKYAILYSINTTHMSPELKQAVQERIELGHSQEQITAELKEAGYDDSTITMVYNATVSPVPGVSAVELPSATALFKQAWGFALSRLDLLALLAVPTFLVNSFAVALEQGWLPMGILTGIGLAVGFLAILFVQFLLQLTLAHTALMTHRSGEASLTGSWNWATSNVWPWLWIATLSFCVAFGGFVLLIIPGVIVSFYIAFAMYAFIDEDTRGMSALQRSRELVTGNFWDILSRFAMFILILLGLSILFGVIATLLSTALGTLGSGIEGITVSVFDSVLTAFASLLGVYFAAGLYTALKQQSVATVPPSGAYPALGWLGAVAFLIFVGLASLGLATYINEVGLENFDWEQMTDTEADLQLMEQQAELTPEQQAEFDAFMEEFGAELDSY